MIMMRPISIRIILFTTTLLILLFSHTSIDASRSRHRRHVDRRMKSNSRDSLHSSHYLESIEPLTYFHITHSEERHPLSGFHPESPPKVKPDENEMNEMRMKRKQWKLRKQQHRQQRRQRRRDIHAAKKKQQVQHQAKDEINMEDNDTFIIQNVTITRDDEYKRSSSKSKHSNQNSIDDVEESESENEDVDDESSFNDAPPDYTNTDLTHWSVNGPPHTYHTNGQPQLYPDTIQLHFIAFNITHTLELHIIRDLFHKDAHITLMDGAHVISQHTHILQSYWSQLDDGEGWATVTLHRNGQFQGIIHYDGDTIQIDPVQIHEPAMDNHKYRKLHQAAHHSKLGHRYMQKGLVVHRHSDFVDLTDSHRHGGMPIVDEQLLRKKKKTVNLTITEPITDTIHPFVSMSRRRRRLLQHQSPQQQAAQQQQQHDSTHDASTSFITSSSTSSPLRRHLLQQSTITNGYGSFPRVVPSITRWTNCYFGDTHAQRMSIGFVVDTGMYEVWGSVAGVQQYIAWQMSVINLIYLTQLSIHLTISDIIIESTMSSTSPSWNDKPPSKGAKCPTTINAKLNQLSAWRGSTQPTRNSIWSLQTNCYPPPGTVGLAWIGVLCNTYYGTSISTYSSNQWLTTAHEIGHNFGAGHTFALGQGKTGGIMDYGDGTLNGQYQFNIEYSKSDICTNLAMIRTSSSSNVFTPYCVTSYQPICGNGVLEPGEACDDKSSCCNQPGTLTPCQLTSSAQCSGETPCCGSCKWKPSSTSCLNGAGYCQNGFCSPSACTGFNGLSYCGMLPNNPCRQQCLSSTTSVCSDGFTSPNLNVPDGTVCKTEPYATCRNGACVSSNQVTYAWSTAEWSSCSCTGQQNRVAYCLGSDGSLGTSGVECPNTSKPVLTQSCTIPTSCVTYKWQISAWSKCSVDCGGGLQSATVQCIADSTKLHVVDSLCTSSSKPSSTQACSIQACPSEFVYSAWSPCSVGCGGGVSTRTVVCQMIQNGIVKTVANTYCQNMQETSQSCNPMPCSNDQSVISFTLSYGVWSLCSVECGTGQQTRLAYCLGSDGLTYDLTKCNCGPNTGNYWCSGAVQACNTIPCPNYEWSESPWGTCSTDCGGGIQTRNVQCMDTVSNQPAPNVNCLQAQPAGVQSCATQTCSTYRWKFGLWQACSKSCGGGTQIRTVNCVTDGNVVVPNEQCADSIKPASEQTCNAQGCPVYTWLIGPWATCSAWCGGGTQTRSVQCVATGSLTPVAYSNCDTSKIPLTAQYCNTAIVCPLNSDVQWKLTSWSDCSQICGGDGIRNRTVACTNSTTGIEVDPKYCPTDYIPEVTSQCESVKCPTYWHTTPWSTCSSPCEGGSQSRQVECRYVNGGNGRIDDTLCSGTRPSETVDCNLFPCPTWHTQPWSECSTRCNDGVQTREITCVTWDNQNTTSDACSLSPLPSSSRICSNKPCPHWHRGPWSYCDSPCGSGNQTRELVCRMPHDDIWHGQIADDETLCPDIGSGDSGDGVGDSNVIFGKPAIWQTCNPLPCPNFYWDVIQWSACTRGCGSGTQEGIVVCKSASQQIVEDNMCLGEPPTPMRICNPDPCPKYEWMATSPWSKCSVDCGIGTQTRHVQCVNTAPAEWKHVQYEIDRDDSYCVDQPKLTTIQSCTFSKSVCFGSPSHGSPANGLCTLDGRCLCRAGYAGQYCEDIPRITNVLTNGGAFTESGIPFGDTLQIKWQSHGEIPYVSILIIRTSANDATLNWPIPSYIAQDIINTGSFSWSVGEYLPDLEGGDGYIIRIWFSSSIYSDTPTPFTIADPCDYKSCGVHGTCIRGGVCQCIPGYSGSTCALGPCERAMCSTSYGSCVNEEYIGRAETNDETMGVCKCGQLTSGKYFDGAQCRTPPGCTPRCKNGADLFNVIIDLKSSTSESKGECGICACRNMWQGDDCSVCGVQCFNGGIPNSQCTSCDCTNSPGYFGSTCGCKYYTMTLELNLLRTFINPSSWMNDTITRARFARTLAIDLALASGQVTGINVEVRVTSLTLDESQSNVLFAEIQFGLECPTLSEERISGGMENDDTMDGFTTRSLHGISTRASSKSGQAFTNRLSTRTIKDKQSSAFYPLRAALEMSNSSASDIGASSSSSLSSSIVIVDGRPTLLSVYDVVVRMFEDLSSPVYRGVLTSSIGENTHRSSTQIMRVKVIRVEDISKEDEPQLPKSPIDPFIAQQMEVSGMGNDPTDTNSSGGSVSLTLGVMIIIIAGGIVFLFCLGCIGIYYCKHSPSDRMVHTTPAHLRSPQPSTHPSTSPTPSHHPPSTEPMVKSPPHGIVGIQLREIELTEMGISPSPTMTHQSSPIGTPTPGDHDDTHQRRRSISFATNAEEIPPMEYLPSPSGIDIEREIETL